MVPQVFFLIIYFLFFNKSTHTIYSYTMDDSHKATSQDRPPCQEQPPQGQGQQRLETQICLKPRHDFFFFLLVLLILTNGFYFI